MYFMASSSELQARFEIGIHSGTARRSHGLIPMASVSFTFSENLKSAAKVSRSKKCFKIIRVDPKLRSWA